MVDSSVRKSDDSTSLGRSHFVVFVWSVTQAIALTLIFDASLFRSICVFGFLLLLGWFFALRGVGAVWIAFGIVSSSILIYGIDRALGIEDVTSVALLLGLLVGFGTTTLLRRRRSITPARLADCDLPALLTAFFLTLRWPQSSSLDYLSLFKYEDNAAWLGIGAQVMGLDASPNDTGPAVVPLRAVMAASRLLHFGIDTSPAVGDSYVILGISYRVIILLAVTIAGCATARMAPVQSSKHRSILAIGSAAFVYVILGLPLAAGHLTLIGALLFIWSLCCLDDISSEQTLSTFCTQVLLLLGAALMWWPVIPFAFALALIHATKLSWFQNLWRRPFFSHLPYRASSIVIASIPIAFATKFSFNQLPLDLRGFFTTKGGLLPLPSSLLLLGFGGLLVLFVWRDKRRVEEGWALTFAALTTYALMMYLVAQFIGPDFAVNYAPAKLLMLLAVFSSPFIFCLPAFLLKNEGGWSSSLLLAGAVIVLGAFVTTWTLNSPRGVNAPTWGTALLESVGKNRIVLCLTSVSELRIEAYICSRHASALDTLDNKVAEAWRNTMLSPSLPSPESEERAKSISEELTRQASAGKEIVVLSLDQPFVVAEIDSWWYSKLPKRKIERLVSSAG